MHPTLLRGLLLVCLLPLALSPTVAATITTITNGLGGAYTYAKGVSDDGTRVVGYADNSDGHEYGYYWLAGTMTSTGTLSPGDRGNSYGTAISGDGGTIVGIAYSTTYEGDRGFKWTVANRISDGGAPGTYLSTATAISRNGTTVVGDYVSDRGYRRAYRRHLDTAQDLGTLAGNNTTSSIALGVSGDGLTVVGASDYPGGDVNSHAFRWRDGILYDLGTLGDSRSQSVAVDTSDDGLTVVGYSSLLNPTIAHAFIWKNGVMTDLGSRSGNSQANAISPDGQLVVGHDASGAFLWDSAHGTRGLRVLLVDLGVDMTRWSSLTSADGIGSDGTNYFIAGSGFLDGSTRLGYLVRFSAAELGIAPLSPLITEAERAGPVITFLDNGAGGQIVKLTTAPTVLGHTYQLQATIDLVTIPWSNLGSPVPGTGARLSFEMPLNPDRPRQFYRMLIQR